MCILTPHLLYYTLCKFPNLVSVHACSNFAHQQNRSDFNTEVSLIHQWWEVQDQEAEAATSRKQWLLLKRQLLMLQ